MAALTLDFNVSDSRMRGHQFWKIMLCLKVFGQEDCGAYAVWNPE